MVDLVWLVLIFSLILLACFFQIQSRLTKVHDSVSDQAVCGKMKIELLPGDSKKNVTDDKKKSYRCQNSILVDSAVDSKLF